MTPSYPARHILKIALTMCLASGLLSGCATLNLPGLSAKNAQPIYPPAPYYLRAHLDDPFSRIESATRSLGPYRSDSSASGALTTAETDLWSRVISRFEFAQCDDFPEANAWSDWFGERPEYIDRVMQRARPWLFDIASELERRDMPGELALLPIVESAYDPFAYSHGRAAGAWQFVAPTARSHGIEINDYYDGRRDVYVATRAALSYLNQLNRRFNGDWNLTLAAYNGGQGRVGRAIARNQRERKPTDWTALSLPRETKAYIPKLHGLACLFQDQERYAVQLPNWPARPLVAKVDLPGPIDVVVFSALMDLDIAQIVALNPGLNQHITSPTGPHHLIVPAQLADQARSVLDQADHRRLIEYRVIQVQAGDTLSELAQAHGTTVDALQTHNQLTSHQIRIGQRLEIPSLPTIEPFDEYADRYQELAVLQARLVPAKRFEHEVKAGENLWVIARRYGVGLGDLMAWNRLQQNDLLRPGQRLTVVIEPPRQASNVQASATRYTVQSGDSLWSIAKRYQIPLVDLMKSNKLEPTSILRPGQTLTLTRSMGRSE